MTTALERIAELHTYVAPRFDRCRVCMEPWPCPTRRLCDDAEQAGDVWLRFAEALAERDAARADAERWLALVRACRETLWTINLDGTEYWQAGEQVKVIDAALAAHDALTEGGA